MRSFGRRRSFVRRNDATTLPFRVTGVLPAFVAAGAGDTLFSVQGIDFPPSAVVYLDGVLQPTSNRISAFLIEFTMAAAVVAVPGLKSIQVKDSINQESNVWQVAVNFPVPTLATINPTFGYLGSGNVPTPSTGTGFYSPGTTGAADASPIPFAYATPTTGTLTVPSAVVDDAGDHAITVSNPTPGGGTSAPRTFQSRYRTPAITSKSLSAIPINSPDTPVTCTDSGGGYYNPSAWPDGGTEGLVDDVPVPTTWLSATQVVVVVPAAVLVAPGTHSIKVRNPTLGGGGGTSAASNFTVSAPTTTALSFATRVRGFDPYVLRVTGTNLSATDTVHYRGEPLATAFVNATTLDGTIPVTALAVAGAGNVTVVTATGFVTNAQTFTVLDWSYADLGSTLRGYYPASTLVDDGTGRASQWTEFVTGVRNPTQPNAALRPDIIPSVPTLNGKPAAYFNGSRGDFLEMEQWVVSTTTGVITKTDYNVWIVASASSGAQVGSNPTILGDTLAFIACGRVTASGVTILDDTGGTVTATAPFNWLTGQTINARFRKTGGSIYVRVNKGTEVSAPHGSPPTLFTPANVLVGKGSSSAGQYSGYLAGWLVTDSNVNHTHRAQIDNLLAAEFATSVGTVSGTLAPTSVAPNTGTQFDTPFEITVTVPGGAVTGDRINVDKYVLATTVDSATTLRAMLTPESLFTAGVKGVTIGNAGGIGPPVALTIAPFVPGSGPNLTSVTPNTCTRCDDPFPMVCAGTNFTPSSVVYAGATALPTSYQGPTQITAQVTDVILFVAGNKSITVQDPAGTSGAQLLSVAAWTLNSVPEISGWWEADDVNVTGSSVTQVNDKTGLMRHAVQATGAKQPQRVLADANFNGQASIDFNGTSQDLVVAGINVSAIFTSQSTFYAIAVYRARTITTSGGVTTPYANQTIFGLNGSGYFGIVTHTGPSLWGFTNDATYKVVQNPALLNLTTQYAVFRRGGGSLFLSINGGTEVQTTGVGNSNYTTQNLSMGSGLTSNYFNGQAALWAAFTATPSAANQTRIKNYTRVRYGWTP